MASKSRRNKVTFKWTKELIFLILFLVAIGAATIGLAIPTRAESSTNNYNSQITAYNSSNSTSYSTLGSTDHVYEEISFENLAKKVNENSTDYIYVLYGSFTQDNFVANFAAINTAADNFEVKKVYLLFSTEIEEDDAESVAFKEKKSEIEGYYTADATKNVDKFDVTKYPALLAFKDGKLVYNTQTYAESTEYSWNNYVNTLFTLNQK